MKKDGKVQDLDVLGNIDLSGNESEPQVGDVDPDDYFAGIDFSKEESNEGDNNNTITETKTDDNSVVDSGQAGDDTTTSTEEDESGKTDDLIKQLLEGTEEVKTTVDQIEDKANELGDSEMLELVKTLQRQNAEKDVTIEELTKAKDVVTEKYLARYGEDTDLGMRKSEIDIMEGNPKLRALVKFRGNPNEKISNKLTNILMDLIFEKDGIDVSELMEKKDKDATSAMLGMGGSDVPPIDALPVVEDKEMTYEDSINNLF